jgi:hypothetical protein
VDENCTGTPGPAGYDCPADAFVSSSTVCRPSADVCDADENCTGSAAACPADVFAPSTTVCRPEAGVCDVAENCSGSGAACPADGFEPTSTICRPSTDVCDPAENCPGSGVDCPADALLPDGTACTDGSECTVSDVCESGVCGGTVSPDSCMDDFNCYKTKISTGTPAFSPVSGVSLVDQFESVTATIAKPRMLCPPTDKNAEGIFDTDTHLVTYQIRQNPRHVRQLGVVVTNQIGTLTVDTMKADTLLVPTAKDLLAAVPPPNSSNHIVDHYKCYKIRVTRGTLPFPKNTTVAIEDQFETPPKLLTLKKPRHLCTPVDKNGEGIKNPGVHLFCYQSAPARGERKHVRRIGIHVNNQFGPMRLDTLKEGEFCIPSTKTLP